MTPGRAQEWGVLAVAGGLAALLMASSVSSFVASRALTDALVRGEGELLFHALRESLVFGRRPSEAELAAFHGRWQAQGLRYVAVFGPRAVVLASAGEPAVEPPTPDTKAAAQWLDEVVRIDRPLAPPGEGPPEEAEGAGPEGQEAKGAGPEGQAPEGAGLGRQDGKEAAGRAPTGVDRRIQEARRPGPEGQVPGGAGVAGQESERTGPGGQGPGAAERAAPGGQEPRGAGAGGPERKGAGPEGQEGKGAGPEGQEEVAGRRRRRGPLVRLEYEPRLAAEVRQRALRDLIVSSTVAVALVIAALVFTRARRRAQRSAGELAKRRHLQALGEMSAVLAHEIRNPLASLKGHAQLLEEKLAGEERKVAKARRIVEEAERLEALTNTLLDFVRAQQIKRRTTDPRALARRAAELTDAARIEIDDAGAPAEFQLDGMRVEQALVNLLKNALQVSPPGTPVQLKVTQEAGVLRYVVSDRGAGVPKELRERIFEPFVSGRTQGTGLGLAVVRRVGELHGGRAEVADRAGGGSEFSLWLPAETRGG